MLSAKAGYVLCCSLPIANWFQLEFSISCRPSLSMSFSQFFSIFHLFLRCFYFSIYSSFGFWLPVYVRSVQCLYYIKRLIDIWPENESHAIKWIRCVDPFFPPIIFYIQAVCRIVGSASVPSSFLFQIQFHIFITYYTWALNIFPGKRMRRSDNRSHTSSIHTTLTLRLKTRILLFT